MTRGNFSGEKIEKITNFFCSLSKNFLAAVDKTAFYSARGTFLTLYLLEVSGKKFGVGTRNFWLVLSNRTFEQPGENFRTTSSQTLRKFLVICGLWSKAFSLVLLQPHSAFRAEYYEQKLWLCYRNYLLLGLWHGLSKTELRESYRK